MYSFITERSKDGLHKVVESRQLPIAVWQIDAPETWERVEVLDEHEAWIDTGYGYVAYFNTSTGYIDVGRSEFIRKSEDASVLVVDKDYFGTPKYIYT